MNNIFETGCKVLCVGNEEVAHMAQLLHKLLLHHTQDWSATITRVYCIAVYKKSVSRDENPPVLHFQKFMALAKKELAKRKREEECRQIQKKARFAAAYGGYVEHGWRPVECVIPRLTRADFKELERRSLALTVCQGEHIEQDWKATRARLTKETIANNIGQAYSWRAYPSKPKRMTYAQLMTLLAGGGWQWYNGFTWWDTLKFTHLYSDKPLPPQCKVRKCTSLHISSPMEPTADLLED